MTKGAIEGSLQFVSLLYPDQVFCKSSLLKMLAPGMGSNAELIRGRKYLFLRVIIPGNWCKDLMNRFSQSQKRTQCQQRKKRIKLCQQLGTHLMYVSVSGWDRLYSRLVGSDVPGRKSMASVGAEKGHFLYWTFLPGHAILQEHWTSLGILRWTRIQDPQKLASGCKISHDTAPLEQG